MKNTARGARRGRARGVSTLRADHAPLILSLLHLVFAAENVRSIPVAGIRFAVIE
jgi:hypothetical protein